MVDDGEMGELVDRFGDEKSVVIGGLFLWFWGEGDGDDGEVDEGGEML